MCTTAGAIMLGSRTVNVPQACWRSGAYAADYRIASHALYRGLAIRLDGACRVATSGCTVNTRGTGDRSGSSFRGISNSRATKRSASSSFDVG